MNKFHDQDIQTVLKAAKRVKGGNTITHKVAGQFVKAVREVLPEHANKPIGLVKKKC